MAKEKVTKMIDGDTFLTSRRTKPVRLANVDAPEKREKGYSEAKAKLTKLILNQEVCVDTVARNKYGYAVANFHLQKRMG
jgi:endonuclease YncB( thermonuclease family)